MQPSGHLASQPPLAPLARKSRVRAALVGGGLCILAITTGVLTSAFLAGPSAAPPSSPNQWNWLEGTYWIVRPQGLPNVLYDPIADDTQTSIGQTVYHIDRCRYGYFHGCATIEVFGADQVQCRRLIGTITPEGKVLLTFIAVEGDQVQLAINAIGTMRREQGQWVMENQMASAAPGDPNSYVMHWAYMFQCEEGDFFWDSLPFVHESVPDFLSQCGCE